MSRLESPSKETKVITTMWKRTVTILPAICAALLWLPQPASSKDVTLFSVNLEGTNGANVTYQVPRDQIASERNAWDPINQPFPVDLQIYLQKAKKHLQDTRELPGPLTTVNIALFPITVLPDPGSDPGHLDRCYLVFHFQITTPDGKKLSSAELNVVMLLDGTIADMKLLGGNLAPPLRITEAGKELQTP